MNKTLMNVFYWISTLDGIKIWMTGLLGISVAVLIGIVGITISYIFTKDSLDLDEGTQKCLKKWLIAVCIIAGISAGISAAGTIFIPSKETTTAMLIGSQATEENAEKLTDAIKGSVDYVFEKIDEVN